MSLITDVVHDIAQEKMKNQNMKKQVMSMHGSIWAGVLCNKKHVI